LCDFLVHGLDNVETLKGLGLRAVLLPLLEDTEDFALAAADKDKIRQIAQALN
jgi:hypothetical protein